ncbi:MAG: aminotransferase class I/II-fold pyridoxal phosphate-dependent enzyme [Candidatus Schekmanbacteria bacterium]|nr:aminotransferase class I/II-fold pyridoxal phosphate-dependent enzyme [Candidatus Schekmanbacteria bacterium]
MTDQVRARRLDPFGTTIFSEMTALAIQHGAVNLAQGFPDFEGPPSMVEAVIRALRAGENQYVRSQGHLRLVRALATRQRERYGLDYDAEREIAVFSGATEGLMSAVLGLVNPGDEVILLEPYYDSYPVCVAMAGGVTRYLPLRFPAFEVNFDELASLFNERTRLLLLNSPHNPTGKVLSAAELEGIAALCRHHDVLVVTDEVYEHLTYGDAVHVPMATLPGMRERTLTISSAGKTFSFTGWKVGWAFGPAPLVAAAQAAHQYVTFCTPGALQIGVAEALESCGADFYAALRSDYQSRRHFLVERLAALGFRVAPPQGTYFVLADFTPVWSGGDDLAFARYLTRACGVAAIPPSVFYRAAPEEGRRLVRFAFCKRRATLEAAAERLRKLAAGNDRPVDEL